MSSQNKMIFEKHVLITDFHYLQEGDKECIVWIGKTIPWACMPLSFPQGGYEKLFRKGAVRIHGSSSSQSITVIPFRKAMVKSIEDSGNAHPPPSSMMLQSSYNEQPHLIYCRI